MQNSIHNLTFFAFFSFLKSLILRNTNSTVSGWQIVQFFFIQKERPNFAAQKPEILGRLLFFYKIYRIETQCPNGSDDVIRSYINRELDNLTYFFNRNLDFYQYYRSHSTLYDEYYFVRGKSDLRLCTDSAQFDKDPNFSTGYDYKVAKIIANEMLRIYLNKRLVKLETNTQVEDNLQKCLKYPFRFTGKKVFLIELGYSLVSSGDINNGNVEIKEMMNFLGTVFQVELGDYYAAYIAMKERKKDRTAYLSRLQDSLVKRMDEDDSKWQVPIFLFASVILFSFNPAILKSCFQSIKLSMFQ